MPDDDDQHRESRCADQRFLRYADAAFWIEHVERAAARQACSQCGPEGTQILLLGTPLFIIFACFSLSHP